MPLYRCSIRGENFPGQLIGERGLYGFYTTRFVEADDAEEAELLGVKALRYDEDFQIESEKLKQQEPPAKIFFEKIVEVAPGAERVPNKGAVWFDMKQRD